MVFVTKTMLARSIDIALFYSSALVDDIDVDFFVRRMQVWQPGISYSEGDMVRLSNGDIGTLTRVI